MTGREPAPTLPGVEEEQAPADVRAALETAAGAFAELAIGAAEESLNADEPASELAYLAAGAAALSAAAAAYTAAVHAVPADEGGR